MVAPEVKHARWWHQVVARLVARGKVVAPIGGTGQTIRGKGALESSCQCWSWCLTACSWAAASELEWTPDWQPSWAGGCLSIRLLRRTTAGLNPLISQGINGLKPGGCLL